MTPKGKTQVKNSDLDKQARVVKKQRIVSNINGGLGNVQFWLDELRKILEEETKENLQQRNEEKT